MVENLESGVLEYSNIYETPLQLSHSQAPLLYPHL